MTRNYLDTQLTVIVEGDEEDVVVHVGREISSQDRSLSPRNSTSLGSTLGDGYERRVWARGNDANHQPEMMIQKVQDKRTEAATKRIHSAIEDSNNQILDTINRRRRCSNAERTYMSIKVR